MSCLVLNQAIDSMTTDLLLFAVSVYILAIHIMFKQFRNIIGKLIIMNDISVLCMCQFYQFNSGNVPTIDRSSGILLPFYTGLYGVSNCLRSVRCMYSQPHCGSPCVVVTRSDRRCQKKPNNVTLNCMQFAWLVQCYLFCSW